MKTSKLTIDQLFDKIREIQRETELLPDDLTVARVAKEMKCGNRLAQKRIQALVDRKLVKEINVTGPTGQPTRAWRAL